MDLHFRCEQQLSGPLQPVIINELDEITSRFLLKNGAEVIGAYVKGCGDIVQGEGARIVLVNILLYFFDLKVILIRRFRNGGQLFHKSPGHINELCDVGGGIDLFRQADQIRPAEGGRDAVSSFISSVKQYLT